MSVEFEVYRFYFEDVNSYWVSEFVCRFYEEFIR